MGKVDFMDTIYCIYMPFGKSLLKGSIGALGHGGGEFCNRGRMWRTKLHMNARGGSTALLGWHAPNWRVHGSRRVAGTHRFGTEASSGYGWNGNSKPAVAAYQPDTDFEMHYCMGRDVRN